MTERVALVTGSSRGLGKVIAHFLGEQGLAVIMNARGAAQLRNTADQLRAGGANVRAIVADVAEPAGRERLVAEVRTLGRLDILVNNASDLGPSPLPPLSRLSPKSLEEILRTNTVGPLALAQELLPWLRASRGLIVNISSDAAIEGYPGWGGYGASKAALDLLSRTLARELKDDGVGVVSVDPGDMRTEMHQRAYPGEDISDRPYPTVTVPFWAWLFGQEAIEVTGGRYRAQADHWEVAA